MTILPNPLCPKCRKDSWAITKQSLPEVSLLRFVVEELPLEQEVTREIYEDAINKSERYKVLFLHCQSCGYVINSSIEKQYD